jgi:hypothetical protein
LKKALIVITLVLRLPCTVGYTAGEAGKPPEESFSADALSANAWFNGPILGAVFAF